MAPGLKLLSFLTLTITFTGTTIANTVTTEEVNHEAATHEDPTVRRDEAATNADRSIISELLPGLPEHLIEVSLPELSARGQGDTDADGSIISGLLPGLPDNLVEVSLPELSAREEAATNAEDSIISDILPGLPENLIEVSPPELSARGEAATNAGAFYPIIPPGSSGCTFDTGMPVCNRSIQGEDGDEDANIWNVIAVRRPSARGHAQ